MDQIHKILLDTWRETCRHIDFHESTSIVARLLARRLPLDSLLVRRFDIHNSALDTVACGSVGNRHPTLGKQAVPPATLRRLIAWGRASQLACSPGNRRTGVLTALIPDQFEGACVAGPLTNGDGPVGVLIFVAKPNERFSVEDQKLVRMLLEPFSAALENDRRLHENTALRATAEADRRSLLTRLGRREIHETIIGADSGLRLVMERVGQVSRSDVPVLTLGETGTGKEVVARAIHSRSPRAAAPFIRVNCGAIPHELIDSQLFGHERGSFTGATDSRKGWFEQADGGTLFLDEIGELSLSAQVRLLRVVQDGYIERVGGEQPIRVDVRIVAATHRDLAMMVKEGSFREDLWYRIAVFPILLPPLCERTEDIAELARHFAERAATRFGLAFVAPSPADLRLLMNYRWPGNIRELGAVIDRAAILGEGKTLEVAPALGVDSVSLPKGVDRFSSSLDATAGAPVGTLDHAMRRHIERALHATRGRVEGPHGAAALLQINPHTLRARMRKLGIAWQAFRSPHASSPAAEA